MGEYPTDFITLNREPELTEIRETNGDPLDKALRYSPESRAFRKNVRAATTNYAKKTGFNFRRPRNGDVREKVQIHHARMFKSFKSVKTFILFCRSFQENF